MTDKIQALRKEMKRTLYGLYFFRNSYRYTNRYYYKFIEAVGQEKYLRSPLVRREWDGARNNFDKMYGLVSAWSKSFDILNGEELQYNEFGTCLDSFIEKKISALKSNLNKISDGVFGLAKASEEKSAKQLMDYYIDIKNSISDIEKAVKDEKSNRTEFVKLSQKVNHIEKIDAIYNELIKFSVFSKKVAEENRKEAEAEETAKSDNGSVTETEDKKTSDKESQKGGK